MGTVLAAAFDGEPRRFHALIVGKRQALLSQALTIAGARLITARRPTHGDLNQTQLSATVEQMYRLLGGRLASAPINPGSWDVCLTGGAVELDEERHFNRYRRTTLSSSLYVKSKGFPLETYKDLCEIRETDCLQAAGWGGNWTNSSCERQFGASSPAKTLADPGPARWKQRAFYDFIKDTAPICLDLPVARLAIWEQIEMPSGSEQIGALLESLEGATTPRLVQVGTLLLTEIQERLFASSST